MSGVKRHIREGIIDEMIVALRRIANDDSVEWASNRQPDVRRYETGDIDKFHYPMIELAILGETKSERSVGGTSRVLDSNMQVLLSCYVKGTGVQELISDILHDVEKVVGLDSSFNCACRDSRITGNQTDIPDKDDGLGAVGITVEVLYGHVDNDPSEQR